MTLDRGDMYGLDRRLATVKTILGSRTIITDIRPALARARRKTPPASASGTLFADLM
ncbi:hypothetical protein [Paraburkholderia phytofirmans]|uniref:Uncharacterized protein n=1 Tax=Paraburkholderia phytofirmans TaxID=261302 RepID=A0ABW9BI06_9BURK